MPQILLCVISKISLGMGSTWELWSPCLLSNVTPPTPTSSCLLQNSTLSYPHFQKLGFCYYLKFQEWSYLSTFSVLSQHSYSYSVGMCPSCPDLCINNSSHNPTLSTQSLDSGSNFWLYCIHCNHHRHSYLHWFFTFPYTGATTINIFLFCSYL